MNAHTTVIAPAERAQPLANAQAPAMTNHVRAVRVDMLRTICILCIVLLHFPMFNPALVAQQQGLDWLALETRDAFSNGFLYLALPTLAFISGYVAWRPGVEVRYGALMRKKFWTLLVPMLIWNAVVLVASFAAQSRGLVSGVRMKLADVDLRLIAEALTGLTRNPVNYPLHFLRDMFVLFALWPVWAWLIKRAPVLGLALVAVVFLGNLDGNLVRRDTMAVTFYVGLLFGSKTWDIQRLDAYPRLALGSLALMAAALIWQGIEAHGEELARAANISIKLAAPLLIWSAAGLLGQTSLGRRLAYAGAFSFPIFLMHAPILQIEYRLFPAFTTTHGAAHVLAWLIASSGTTALCVAVCIVAKRRWPRAAALAFGGR